MTYWVRGGSLSKGEATLYEEKRWVSVGCRLEKRPGVVETSIKVVFMTERGILSENLSEGPKH